MHSHLHFLLMVVHRIQPRLLSLSLIFLRVKNLIVFFPNHCQKFPTFWAALNMTFQGCPNFWYNQKNSISAAENIRMQAGITHINKLKIEPIVYIFTLYYIGPIADCT